MTYIRIAPFGDGFEVKCGSYQNELPVLTLVFIDGHQPQEVQQQKHLVTSCSGASILAT